MGTNWNPNAGDLPDDIQLVSETCDDTNGSDGTANIGQLNRVLRDHGHD